MESLPVLHYRLSISLAEAAARAERCGWTVVDDDKGNVWAGRDRGPITLADEVDADRRPTTRPWRAKARSTAVLCLRYEDGCAVASIIVLELLIRLAILGVAIGLILMAIVHYSLRPATPESLAILAVALVVLTLLPIALILPWLIGVVRDVRCLCRFCRGCCCEAAGVHHRGTEARRAT